MEEERGVWGEYGCGDDFGFGRGLGEEGGGGGQARAMGFVVSVMAGGICCIVRTMGYLSASLGLCRMSKTEQSPLVADFEQGIEHSCPELSP
jgi:hypothetical protein